MRNSSTIPSIKVRMEVGSVACPRKARRMPIRSSWRKVVARIVLLLMVVTACERRAYCAATAPRYGGTLIVELHTPTLLLDPAKWKAGAPENAADLQMASAVFDRLVTLDRFGRFQPALATEWSHDGAWRRWQFTLRSGVQFSDGSVLTAADVAAALQELAPGFAPSKPVVTVSGNHVVVQFSSAVADLLEQLASGGNFIFRRSGDDALLGTGPFYVAAVVQASGGTFAHYDFAGNEHCWSGRPFVDRVQVSLGVPILRQLFDLQLGKAQVVELSPELVRRAAQENLRVWSSAPVLLYALQVSSEVHPESRPSSHGESRGELRGDVAPSAGGGAADRLGEALSLALDRDTMANVLLQKQAEPAASFLPQWLSGYASVFSMENDVERAKKISGALFPASSAQNAAQPLHLRVDAAGDLARLIAERVAINARQAGISVQLQSRGGVVRESSAVSSGGATGAIGKTAGLGSLRLIAWRYSSLSERAELDTMIAGLQLDKSGSEASSTDAEELFTREQRLLAERSLIPLVVMPEYIGLGSPVRDWMPERWGAWHLADVWLDEKRSDAAEMATGKAQR